MLFSVVILLNEKRDRKKVRIWHKDEGLHFKQIKSNLHKKEEGTDRPDK